ncbi:HNH endonuclease [Polaromonas sp.]
MKLSNLASLDERIVESGRVGLKGASTLDREIWAELDGNWDATIREAGEIYDKLATSHGEESDIDLLDEVKSSIATTRLSTIEVRTTQARFRRSVLTSYNATCCISGLSDAKLVVASHIIPWSKGIHDRMNPRNGLCLSALHDKAFDRGLITVLPNLRVCVSSTLKNHTDQSPLMKLLLSCDGQRIVKPDRFSPREDFLTWHATVHGFI